MPATQSPAFSTAVENSRKLKQKPTTQELLDLYALYKQGTQDPPFSETEKPSMFDMKNKAKYNAWSSVAEEGVTAEEAQERYAKLVGELAEKYGMEG
ncbi:MAG: hypothetical protein Q9190_005553 [Brigantiaea leucoxantha]